MNAIEQVTNSRGVVWWDVVDLIGSPDKIIICLALFGDIDTKRISGVMSILYLCTRKKLFCLLDGFLSFG